MEGICFEVKPRSDPVRGHSLCTLAQTRPGSGDMRDGEVEIQYRLTLVGSLAIHPKTTMTMLPWVVAEIRRPHQRERNRSPEFTGAHSQEVSLFSTSYILYYML